MAHREPLFYDTFDSPFGPIRVAADETGLRRVIFLKGKRRVLQQRGWVLEPGRLASAREQLEAYFAGRLMSFDLPLAPKGTRFQERVWKALLNVPYGATASYGEIAAALGNPKASRAVGLANGKNPIAIIIPCHRIIGANGHLTGYGSGLKIKAGLLRLEGHHIEKDRCVARF
jgi:methylated-DNA-[protein]-cysteine S-methyltransferase